MRSWMSSLTLWLEECNTDEYILRVERWRIHENKKVRCGKLVYYMLFSTSMRIAYATSPWHWAWLCKLLGQCDVSRWDARRGLKHVCVVGLILLHFGYSHGETCWSSCWPSGLGSGVKCMEQSCPQPTDPESKAELPQPTCRCIKK